MAKNPEKSGNRLERYKADKAKRDAIERRAKNVLSQRVTGVNDSTSAWRAAGQPDTRRSAGDTAGTVRTVQNLEAIARRRRAGVEDSKKDQQNRRMEGEARSAALRRGGSRSEAAKKAWATRRARGRGKA